MISDTETKNQTDEKLLTGTEAELLLPPIEDRATLSAKEFLKYTPTHELRSVFGMTKEETQKQGPAQSASESVFQTSPTPKETLKPEILAPTKKRNLPHPIISFLAGFILFSIIIIIVFYVWGGILLGK